MIAPARMLVVSGLGLMLASIVFAMVFSLSAGHQPRLAAYDDYRNALNTIVASQGTDQVDAEAVIGVATQSAQAHRHASSVHTHLLKLGLLLSVMGLYAALLEQAKNSGRTVCVALICSALVYGGGLLLQFFGIGVIAQGISALGAGSIIVSLACLYHQLIRAVDTL